MSEKEETLEKEEPAPRCEQCGSVDAQRFGGQWICDECYVECGACCADEE